MRVIKQMNPPEMRDIDLERGQREEGGAGKDDELTGDKDLDLQQMSSQKRKRADGPSTPLTPKKRICSEAKKKDPEVPEPVQANPETRALTRRALPSRNIFKDVEQVSTEDKTKHSLVDTQDKEKQVKTIKDEESQTPSKHLQPYVLLPILSLKHSESQPTEEVSTLQSRTRSKTMKNAEELPAKKHEETVIENRTKSPRGRVSIPENLSEKVSDESVADKDEPSTVMEMNPKKETVPLQRRRGGGLRDAKTALPESNLPSSQKNRDEVDLVSRRFQTRATEEPAKEGNPLEKLKSNVGKKKGGQTRKGGNSKAEQDMESSNLSTTSILEQSETVKTPEAAADPGLDREKKTAPEEERHSRTCRTGGTTQTAKRKSHSPVISSQKEEQADNNRECSPTRTTRSVANISSQVSAVPTMIRMAEGKRIVVILNKALIAEAKKRYRQLNPRISLKRLTKRVGKMENEMKRLIARNELRGRLTFLLHIDLKQHEVSCLEVMKRQVIPEATHVDKNGLDGTEERTSKRASLEERGGDSETTRQTRSRRGEVSPTKKEHEATTIATTRTAQRLPKEQAKRKGSRTRPGKERVEGMGRSGGCGAEKRQDGRNDEEEDGEMDLFYQICPLRPCSLTKGGPGQSCGRRGARRKRDAKRSDKRKKTSLWQLARDPTNLSRGKLLALHAFTYDGSGVNLWDDDEDEEEEEERKRAWRSTHHQPPILSDLTNKGRSGKVIQDQVHVSFISFVSEGAIPASKEA